MKKLFLLLTAVLLSAGMVVQAAQPVGKNSTPKQCQLIQKSAGSSTFYVKILATNNYGGANKYIFLANVTMNSPTSISGTHFFYNENDNNCYWVQQFNSSTGAVYIDCPICGNLTFTRIGTDASTGAPKYRIQLATGMGYNNALQTGFEATWELPVFCKQSDGTTTIELTDELEDTHNYTQHYYWDDMVVEGSLYVASNYAVVRSQVQANRTDFGETCYPALNLDFIVDPNKENKTNGYLSACSHGWYVPYYGTWSNVYTSTSRLNNSSYVGYIVKDAKVGTSNNNSVAAASYFAPNTQNIYKFTGGTIYILNGSADNHPYFYCDMVSSGTTILTTIGNAPVYTITYKDQGNVAFSGVHGSGYPTTHTFGKATTLVNPTKSGYTFDGWYTNSACTTSAGSSIGATAQQANFTLYAKWTASAPTTHTLTLNVTGNGTVTAYSNNNGEFVTFTNNEAEIENEDEIVITYTPAAGYHVGTHTDSEEGNINSGDGIFMDGDHTITVTFEPDVYTITYKDQGDVAFTGTQTDAPTTHTYGTATTLKIPTKDGYNFGGWFTASDCQSGAVGNTTSASLGATDYTADITLYAKWEVSSRTVTQSVGANGTLAVYNVTASEDVVFTNNTAEVADGTTLRITATGNTGYHLNTLTVGGNIFTSGNTYNVTSNVTIAATFAPNTNTAYTVKHYQQNLDGTYPSTPTETQNLTGTTATNVTPAVKSYTGFTAPSTQTEAILADGTLVIEYQYTRNTYTLTWTTDGDALTGDYTHGTVAYGTTIAQPATPTKTGYTFNVWSPTPAATMPAANTEYTATWTAKQYNITYKDQGDAAFSGVHGSGYPTKHTYGSATELVSPTKSGYNFLGWYDNSECTGDAITTIAANSITADITLYAKWEVAARTVTITAPTNGTITVSYNDGSAQSFTSGSRNIAPGTTLTITAVGTSGHDLATLTVGGKGFTSGNTLTLTENITIVATFGLTLCESCNNAHYNSFLDNDGRTENVIYNRTFVQGRWSTLCLPFNVSSAQMTNLRMKGRVYEFRYATGNANDGNKVTLYFSAPVSLEAGKCYIVNANNALAGRSSFVFNNVTFNLAADKVADLTVADAYDGLDGYSDPSQTDNKIELVGTLRKGTLKIKDSENTYMGLKENKIYYPNTTSGSTVLAYRGVFRSINGASLEVMERVRIVVDGEDAGELEVVNGELQAVPETRKFIRDGVLYIEREGVIYDAAGQRVE